jgi:hypothetical protein
MGRMEILDKLKKLRDLIGILTRDLPACSTAPQPTTRPRGLGIFLGRRPNELVSGSRQTYYTPVFRYSVKKKALRSSYHLIPSAIKGQFNDAHYRVPEFLINLCNVLKTASVV